MSVSNFLVLWRQIVRNPKALGTVAPSSPFLARSLVEAADLKPEQKIVEVGAGTGPLTKWILEFVNSDSFLALEPNEEMAAVLRSSFKGLDVRQQRAQELESICEDRGWVHVHKVLSSLPWSLIPEETQDEVLHAITKIMHSDGRMLTLVYSHAQYFPSSIKLERKFYEHFQHVYRTRTVWRNLPPGYWLVGERPRRDLLPSIL